MREPLACRSASAKNARVSALLSLILDISQHQEDEPDEPQHEPELKTQPAFHHSEFKEFKDNFDLSSRSSGKKKEHRAFLLTVELLWLQSVGVLLSGVLRANRKFARFARIG